VEGHAGGIQDLFGVGSGDFEALVPGALAAVRKHLGMDVAFLSEFSEGRRVFRFVDAGTATPVAVGGSDPLEESYCQRVVDGRLPQLIQDASLVPAAAALPVTAALPVGAHVSVPVRFADGSVYGTFCCFSSVPDHSLNERDLAIVRVLAEWAGATLEKRQGTLNEHRAARGRIEAAIEKDGSLSSVYQPIYRLASKTISGFECLTRFSVEPKRSPDVWFAEAKVVGLGPELELKAIEIGLKGVMAVLPSSVYVAVNVSPWLLSDRRLHSIIDQMPPDRVVLEFTEHENVLEYDRIIDDLGSLRARGIRVAVDDAGAGYSSFRHILEMLPAFIKLDMSLTRGIDKDPVRRALAAAFVRFCDEIGSTLIAEGIETPEELKALQDLGVAAGQGYLLQKPQSLSAAVALL
jgi:EAL domain-containing protein (putative c-di-GMP-specific phosphodiesterase class I)